MTMGMYDAVSDRDHDDECHSEGRQPLTLPCAHCRTPVDVDSRTASIFVTFLCDRCQADDYQVNGKDPRR